MTPPSTLISPTPAPNNQTADQTQPPLNNTPPQPNHGNPQHHGGPTGKLPLSKKINKKLQIALLAIFVVLIAGAGIYFVFFSRAGVSMTGSEGEFTPVTPARILDTRSNSNVGGVATLGAQTTKSVKVLGQGGLPSTGVKAVVMNVTVANPTAASYLTVWQSGTTKPLASSLNFVAGQVLSNQVTVPVASDGTVQVYNNTGNVDVIFDVVGYFATTEGNPGSRYVAINPDRIVDTRGAIGSTTLTPSQTANVQIAGNGSVPPAGLRAVVMNVTVVNSTAAGYLTIWPTGTTKPNVSSINFAANQVLSNQVTVPVGADGKVSMFNNAGNTNVIYDVVGYYEDVAPGYDQTQAGRYGSVTPARILDTRPTSGTKSTGASSTIGGISTLGPMSQTSVKISGEGGVPPSDVRAVTMNVTVVNPSAPGFLTIWPSLLDRPGASSINFAAGQTLSNQITVPVSENGYVQLYNSAGNTNVIFDVLGYYVEYPSSVSVSQWMDMQQITPVKILSSNVSYEDTQVGGTSGTQLRYNNSVKWYDATQNSTLYLSNQYWIYFNDYGESMVSLECQPIISNPYTGKSYRASCVSLQQPRRIDSYTSNGATDSNYYYYLPVDATNFKIITTIVTNIDNVPGTWVKYSMANPDSPAVDLMRVKIADTNLTTPAISGLGMKVNSSGQCSSTSGSSLKVFNLMGDNKLIPLADFSSPGTNLGLVNIYNNSTPECPGVSKTELIKGSDRYEGYTDWGILFRNSIPKDRRDTTKPVISNTQAVGFNGSGDLSYWDSVNQTFTTFFVNKTTYLASAKATDDNLVTDFSAFVSDSNVRLGIDYCLDNKTIDYIKAAKGLTFPTCDQTLTNQRKELYELIDITSIPYAPIRFQARDNSGNEATLMYTPRY